MDPPEPENVPPENVLSIEWQPPKGSYHRTHVVPNSDNGDRLLRRWKDTPPEVVNDEDNKDKDE